MASLWLMLFSTLCFLYFHGIVESISNEEIEYECVDIFKQPSFQHPSMKGHQIQTIPSDEFEAMISKDLHTSALSNNYEFKECCPNGQVPIHTPNPNFTNKVITEASLHYAIIKSFENSTDIWYGARAVLSIYKPLVKKDQFSKAWIWLNHKDIDTMASIQFGWAVHTELYRDDRPRLTTYWLSNKKKSGCYNALCPGGYVQVHKSIFPGLIFDKISIQGGHQYDVDLLVGQDPKTENWLLMTKRTLIGYWPNQSYPIKRVTQVYFGGYTGGLPGATSPPMGAANFPRQVGFRPESCYMKQLKCFKDKRLVDINSNEFEEYVDSPKCYDVWFRKYEIDKGEIITFGGPGGMCGL